MSVPVSASTVPGTEMPAPIGVSPSVSHSVERLSTSSASSLEGELRRARAVVVPDGRPEADGTAQVADARSDVVDVDLEAESGDATVVELEDLRGAPDPPAVREARLRHDAALDQLGDEARDRRLVEPGELCKLRARDGPGLRDAPRDEAQVGLADRSLVCAPHRSGMRVERVH